MRKARQCVVDGTRVEEIDTAILQLLASLWRTSLERGIACTWHGASEALRQTAALVGVAELLQFPECRARASAAAMSLPDLKSGGDSAIGRLGYRRRPNRPASPWSSAVLWLNWAAAQVDACLASDDSGQ